MINSKVIVAAAVLGVLVTAFTYHFATVKVLERRIDKQVKELDTQNTTISRLKQHNAQLVLANQEFDSQLTRQTEQLKRMQDLIRVSNQKADAALIKARADSQKWKTAYNRILKMPEGAPEPGEQCVSVEKRLLEYVETRQRGGV